MPRDGKITRNRILEMAERMVLHRGFAGTSIELLIGELGITKGTFFYHFKSKRDLALALIERHAEHDGAELESFMTRAENLTRDPLQQLLVFVGLFEEVGIAMEKPPDGCLFGAYSYEQAQFDEEIRAVSARAIRRWRVRVGDKIKEAMALYPPRIAVTPEDLADTLVSAFEGAFILGKIFGEPTVFARQLRQFKNYVELLFGREGPPPASESSDAPEAATKRTGVGL